MVLELRVDESGQESDDGGYHRPQRKMVRHAFPAHDLEFGDRTEEREILYSAELQPPQTGGVAVNGPEVVSGICVRSGREDQTGTRRLCDQPVDEEQFLVPTRVDVGYQLDDEMKNEK